MHVPNYQVTLVFLVPLNHALSPVLASHAVAVCRGTLISRSIGVLLVIHAVEPATPSRQARFASGFDKTILRVHPSRELKSCPRERRKDR